MDLKSYPFHHIALKKLLGKNSNFLLAITIAFLVHVLAQNLAKTSSTDPGYKQPSRHLPTQG